MTEQAAPPPDVQVFRPPVAVAIWWVWLLFALGNLIDLAVQGRDHLALTAAFTLLLITAVVYVTAQRPRVVVGPAGLTVVNPVTEHQVGWAAVAAAEPGELLRVRCEWPEADGTRQRVIQAWAVHSSRRRELTAELRAQRQARRGAGGGLSGLLGGGFGGNSGAGLGSGAGGRSGGTGFGSFGAPGARPAGPAAEPDALRLDPARVIAVITERAEQARQGGTDDLAPAAAVAPVSAWNWRAVALVLVSALALLVVALA